MSTRRTKIEFDPYENAWVVKTTRNGWQWEYETAYDLPATHYAEAYAEARADGYAV